MAGSDTSAESVVDETESIQVPGEETNAILETPELKPFDESSVQEKVQLDDPTLETIFNAICDSPISLSSIFELQTKIEFAIQQANSKSKSSLIVASKKFQALEPRIKGNIARLVEMKGSLDYIFRKLNEIQERMKKRYEKEYLQIESMMKST